MRSIEVCNFDHASVKIDSPVYHSSSPTTSFPLSLSSLIQFRVIYNSRRNFNPESHPDSLGRTSCVPIRLYIRPYICPSVHTSVCVRMPNVLITSINSSGTFQHKLKSSPPKHRYIPCHASIANRERFYPR